MLGELFGLKGLERRNEIGVIYDWMRRGGIGTSIELCGVLDKGKGG